jgi:predicted AAA+ superfamily ATPase
MIMERDILHKITPVIESPEAIVLTGMRRTGKTTLMRILYDRISSPNKLFLDLENPLYRRYFEEDNYDQIWKSLEFLGLDPSTRAYVFLDEIQLQSNVPSVVKYLMDHRQVKFFLTGSASFYLKNLFTESLAGRKYLFELFPLTFAEFLIFKELPFRPPDPKDTISPALFDTIRPAYEEYVQYGGFPGVVLKDNSLEKQRMLADIFTSYYQLEVLQIGDFRRNDKVRDLLLLLAQRIGSRLDEQKLSRDLGISRPTVAAYLSFLEGTYLIQTIPPWSTGRGTEIRKQRKVYFTDTGLASHLAQLPPGVQFENCVFQNLRTQGTVNYYQRKGGAEIDFILDGRTAYEVKQIPQAVDRNRLEKICTTLGIPEYHLVARQFNPRLPLRYGFQL